jgi:hypothetical protein
VDEVEVRARAVLAPAPRLKRLGRPRDARHAQLGYAVDLHHARVGAPIRGGVRLVVVVGHAHHVLLVHLRLGPRVTHGAGAAAAPALAHGGLLVLQAHMGRGRS